MMNLYDLFDGAQAHELDVLVGDNFKLYLPKDASLDSIKKKVCKKTGISFDKHKPLFRLKSIVAFAVSVCLIIGILLGSALLFKDNPDDITDDKVMKTYSIDEMLDDFDINKIVWGSVSDDLPNSDSDSDSDNDCFISEKTTWGEWNGIKVNGQLYIALKKSNEDYLLAVGVYSLLGADEKLENFVYEGKTYAQLKEERDAASKLNDALYMIRKVALSFKEDNLSDEHAEDMLEKLFAESGKDLVYEYYDGSVFDYEKIENDAEKYFAELEAIKGKLSAHQKAYSAQTHAPDLSMLAQSGYYVVEHNDKGFIITDAQKLAKLAEVLKLYFDGNTIENAVFTLVTLDDIGLVPNDDQPTEDDMDIKNEITDDIPYGTTDEAFPDDIAKE